MKKNKKKYKFIMKFNGMPTNVIAVSPRKAIKIFHLVESQFGQFMAINHPDILERWTNEGVIK